MRIEDRHSEDRIEDRIEDIAIEGIEDRIEDIDDRISRMDDRIISSLALDRDHHI